MNLFSRGETTTGLLATSSIISRAETFFPLKRVAVDVTARTLLKQVEQLLNARPDVTRADFGRAIVRGHSWISEFFGGKRTTNDLRLVIQIARFFGVQVSYLLGEKHRKEDAQTVSLLGAWEELEEAHREIVLRLALQLPRKRRPNEK